MALRILFRNGAKQHFFVPQHGLTQYSAIYSTLKVHCSRVFVILKTFQSEYGHGRKGGRKKLIFFPIDNVAGKCGVYRTLHTLNRHTRYRVFVGLLSVVRKAAHGLQYGRATNCWVDSLNC